MTTHIMLDLETWGTTPGSDLRSIGAVVFDPIAGTVGANVPFNDCPPSHMNDALWAAMREGGNPYGFYAALDNPRVLMSGTWNTITGKYKLTRDPKTAQWWSEQSDEAQAAFANPVDLKDGLYAFGKWLADKVMGDGAHAEAPHLKVWAHGANFDPPILAAAYEAVSLPLPWHYRAPRDTRTIFDVAGIEDHSAWLNQFPGPLGINHHALDDAICQARAVCAAWGHIEAETIERAAVDAVGEMMGEFVDNWPNPKRLDTALKMVAKTIRILLNPPKHRYWGAGEPDCPDDIKAGNGEIHTLRCKVCGETSPRDKRCLSEAAIRNLTKEQQS